MGNKNPYKASVLDRYSNEEKDELLNLLSKAGHDSVLSMVNYASQYRLVINDLAGSVATLDLEGMLGEKALIVLSLQLPFERIPLYVHSISKPIPVAILKWRLEVGK